MADWEALRSMYDEIEVPIALMRFARELMHEVIDDVPMPKESNHQLYKAIEQVLMKHIQGKECDLANYLVVLMDSYPATDPYQHLDEK
jgi:hypothetical protein